jgi:hypothetical protein
MVFIHCLFNLQVYHPNIDLEGNVCLNILREDWKPVLNINTIIYGLYHLFTVLFCVFNYQVHPCDFVGIWYLWPLYIYSVYFIWYCAFRNQITRIPLIMMLQQCWGTTQRCLNLMWEGLWLAGMWGNPSFHGVFRFYVVVHSANSNVLSMLECPWL